MESENLVFCMDWKIAGQVVGWLSIALSIGLSVFFWLSIFNGHNYLEFIVLLVLLAINVAASVIWLRGIAMKFTKLLLVSLIWWAIPLTLWSGFLVFITFNGILERKAYNKFHKTQETIKPTDHYHPPENRSVYFFTGLCITLYFTAVMCFMSVRRVIKGNDRAEAQQTNVEFGTRAENKGLMSSDSTSKVDQNGSK